MSWGNRHPHFLTDAVGWTAPFGLAIGLGPRLLARSVTIAGDSTSRRRGLLGRAPLGPEDALIVAPTFAVHTFGMRFPLDIAFVDRSGLVLGLADHVPARRLRVCWGAFAAIELASGRCRAVDLQIGDELRAVAAPG